MSRFRTLLVPKLFSHWWETLERPHRLLDQRFVTRPHLDDFFNSSMFDRKFEKLLADHFHRPWSKFLQEYENGWFIVKNDKNKFHVCLDVQQFEPDEINVKVVDDFVVIEGKHEEKEDGYGKVSRHFVRKYMIPEQCDLEKVMSTLSSDGVLTITVPRKPEAIGEKKEKVINVEHTGKPVMEDETETKAAQK